MGVREQRTRCSPGVQHEGVCLDNVVSEVLSSSLFEEIGSRSARWVVVGCIAFSHSFIHKLVGEAFFFIG